MKTYKEFITELNKFEKFLLKQGIKVIKKLNPGQTHKAVKKVQNVQLKVLEVILVIHFYHTKKLRNQISLVN